MSAEPLEEGVYFIQNVASGTCLDLTNGEQADGTLVKAVTKTDITGCWVPTQLWIISLHPDRNEGTYHIENATGRTFLELKTKTGNVMCNAVNGDINESKRQWWQISRNDNTKSYLIRNGWWLSFVELKDGNVASGTDVVGSSNTGITANTTPDAKQLWHIVRA